MTNQQRAKDALAEFDADPISVAEATLVDALDTIRDTPDKGLIPLEVAALIVEARQMCEPFGDPPESRYGPKSVIARLAATKLPGEE